LRPHSSPQTSDSRTTIRVYPKLLEPEYRRLVRRLATVQSPAQRAAWLRDLSLAELEIGAADPVEYPSCLVEAGPYYAAKAKLIRDGEY
jgi:hypothetical protein